jgi:altronate dehydratase small subunit
VSNAIILDESDNVATAIVDIAKGDTVQAHGLSVEAIEPIPFGHKLALKPLADGEIILKYGESIGLALGAIAQGACVHIHNVDSQRGRGDLGGN